MTVRSGRELKAAARPEPPDTETLAYTSKVTASHFDVPLEAIKDQVEPSNSADVSVDEMTFWAHKGTTEWIQLQWYAKQAWPTLYS